MDEPTKPQTASDKYAEAIKCYGKHFACLVISYIWLDERGQQTGEQKLLAISGFVMSFNDEWFFVTAGHVLKEGIDEKLATGTVKMLGAAIKDDFGAAARFPHPTIIDYDSCPKWYIDRPEMGLDFAVIHLRDLYRAGLESNGIVPIREENWIKLPEERLTEHFLLGIPTERTSEVRSEPGPSGEMATADIQPLLLLVERTDKPHRELPETPFPWFVGFVHTTALGVKSIEGMSGGPIFGFRRDANGDTRYWVVALQSWWDRDTCTVYGCPVPVFARLVVEAISGPVESAEDVAP